MRHEACLRAQLNRAMVIAQLGRPVWSQTVIVNSELAQ